MTLNWKGGLYILVVVAAAAAIYVEQHMPKPRPPRTPVVVTAPAPVPVVVPAPEPVIVPVPVSKPKPIVRKRVPRSTFKAKPRNQDLRCHEVPREAYSHPSDVVLAAAARMGVEGDRLATLKWCIGAR